MLKIKNKGFTLIELLVVISIIGILAALTLSGFTGAQKQARDTVRKSDLNQYRIALETYAAGNNQKYPGLTAADTNCKQEPVDKLYGGYAPLVNYMSSALIDPKDTGSYKYYYCEDGDSQGATATKFVLRAKFETGGNWFICSNGKVGKIEDVDLPNPLTSICPLP